MSTTQETSVTSSQDRCAAVEVPKKGAKINGETKAVINGGKSTVEELFPWIIEFKKKCRCLLAQPNIVALIKLMKFYARNVSINVNECYTKPYRAAKLKDSISETLLFFLFYFRELVEVCDKNSYLDKMSDLLAMYLDMELKASRRGKEHHSKIAARLTSCLYVYLENSSEHILDTFIKAKFINRNYHEILDPVLMKISKTLPAQPNCDTMYVRYLLIYRLWKKVNNDAAVKNQINATAILHLGPPPSSPTPFLAKYVLPKVPKSQANSTKFLLLHKFDIEKSCRLFIQYCKENREDEDQGDLDKPNFVANALSSDTLEPLVGRGTNHVDNLTDNVNILPEAERRHRIPVKTNNNNSDSLPGKYSVQESIKGQKTAAKHEPGEVSPLKPLRPTKALPRLKTKKTGNILFIDLTADEITEKIIKKKKQRKLHWLTEVKKKLNTKTIKAAEKKKKAQTTPSNLSDDLTLSGLVDSTSAGSLSTATTPEPTIYSATNPVTEKSLSTATTPEPENCVTSNSVENELEIKTVISNDNEVSHFVEKQPICDVTTTVTETIPIASNKLELIMFDSNDPVPSCEITISQTESNNHLPGNSCHTTYEQNKITVTELSDALSHVCESYDNGDSVLDLDSTEEVDFKQNENATGETDFVDSKKDLKSMELDEDSEVAQRSSSESSDVAVIFTRRASDVEIVNLDDYAEDNSQMGLSVAAFCELGKSEEGVCSSTDSTIDEKIKEFADKDLVENSETREINDLPSAILIKSDVKDLTLRTNQLKLANACEILKNENENENENQLTKISETRNGSFKENRSSNSKVSELIDSEKTNKPNLYSKTNDPRLIKTRSENETLIEEKQQEKLGTNESKTQQNNLEKLEPSKLVHYDIRKHCDYGSSKGNFEGGREKEYIEEHTSIPKINEILICTKNNETKIRDISNDLLTTQEPQFIENIDGLSLLASVSQHVSHLEEYSDESLSKPKIIDGKITQTNSEAVISSEIDTVIEEIGSAEDSYEVLLDLNVDTSNEIVGVQHQIIDNKINVADLKFGNFESHSPDIAENGSLDVVPLILETTVDLNSSTLHNNLISVENVTQMIKESTNVIVNGETVVLFQKSPHSNLYIINKAADGKMECLGEDKKNVKNVERNSTMMRDIINHIPINLSGKNTELKDGGKNHRSKTSGLNKTRTDGVRKTDNATKKYDNQILSKQFKPIREKLKQYEDEYIKKEIINTDNYEETFRQRCTDTPGSVIELEPVNKSPPPVIRLTDTPVDVKMLVNHEEIYKESTAINMAKIGKLNGNLGSNKIGEIGEGTSNENLSYKQNIKQEFQNRRDNLHNELNRNSQQVARGNYTNVNLLPVNPIHSPKIPPDYSTVSTATSLYNLERERCNYPLCNLKVDSSQAYHSIPQSVPSCQLSHCACLKCAYEVHCGQYIQRPAPTVAHSSYIQTNSYFFTSDSSSKECAVKEKEFKLNEAATLAKLDDDQLLHNIEQSIIDNKQLNQTSVKTVKEINYKQEFDNKLPLKKRLKAHAMLSMSYEGAPIKIEKVENYPGTPMMSIAALETRNLPQTNDTLYEDKPTPSSTTLELSPRVKDDSLSNHTTEMIRRDYLKDTSLTSIGNCANVEDRGRKLEQQRRQTNSHVNIMGTGCQRSFKTPAQRKEVTVPSPTSLKRAATTVANYPKSPKKGKKAKVTANCRQTRSSKRNMPKVDYSYDGIIDSDPKFNTLNELRRKRKKTSR